jgi:hypothetical protein
VLRRGRDAKSDTGVFCIDAERGAREPRRADPLAACALQPIVLSVPTAARGR